MILEGKYFHTIHGNGTLGCQGRVISKLADEYYLVELFEWGLGRPSHSVIVHVKNMCGWRFYNNAEDMHES